MIKSESVCLIYLNKHSTYLLNKSPIYSAYYWAFTIHTLHLLNVFIVIYVYSFGLDTVLYFILLFIYLYYSNSNLFIF